MGPKVQLIDLGWTVGHYICVYFTFDLVMPSLRLALYGVI